MRLWVVLGAVHILWILGLVVFDLGTPFSLLLLGVAFAIIVFQIFRGKEAIHVENEAEERTSRRR